MNGLEQVGQTCFFLTFSASTISLAVWMGGGAMVEGWVGGAGGGGSEGVLAERAGVDAALVEVDAGSMFSGGGRASYEYAESGGEGKGERPDIEREEGRYLCCCSPKTTWDGLSLLLDEGMWDGEEMRACERTRTRERDSTSLLVARPQIQGTVLLNPTKQPSNQVQPPPLLSFSLSTLLDVYALNHFVCFSLTIVLSSPASPFLLSLNMIHSKVIRPETRARQRNEEEKKVEKNRGKRN